MRQIIELNVNGELHEVMVHPRDLLVDVLRRSLGYTGTKKGCGQAACGACTVLLDGRPILSCITLAIACRGHDIRTVEGLEQAGELHPLQQSFVQGGAIQCGFCTPGMLMSGKALLARNPAPTIDEIKVGMAGNLCRCTGYAKIISAVAKAAETMSEREREGV
ncbi:MAG: (2Fe-2S)-binding protein [Polyangiaceae bacterium]|jgi:carbon-monoxide dehydrogenase small subunit|nr:(2Fe-2S)-binding protein [Polyangiaceae bacterium]